jgi:hypothetical protein
MCRLGWSRFKKAMGEPLYGGQEAEALEMNHEIDGAAATGPSMPVEKLGGSDGEHALAGAPLRSVMRIRGGTSEEKHGV